MNALSQNPDDCFVFAYFEIPAIYASVIHYKMLRMPQQIVGKDTLDLTNAALNTYFELKTERQIIVYKHLIVKQLAKSVLQKKTHWLYFAKGTPLKRIAREGGFTEWKEVFFCGGSLNAQQRGLIIQVQKSLKAKGYYTGKIDNTLNKKTKAALLKFQKDNALPVGTINLRTLNALGVHDVYYDL